MKASVHVRSDSGAAINATRILKVRAEPTLENAEFLTIFDASSGSSAALLDYTQSPAADGGGVGFQFLWQGKHLRCDVFAHLEVMVVVEFEATRPLLLSVGSNGAVSLHGDSMLW